MRFLFYSFWNTKLFTQHYNKLHEIIIYYKYFIYIVIVKPAIYIKLKFKNNWGRILIFIFCSPNLFKLMHSTMKKRYVDKNYNIIYLHISVHIVIDWTVALFMAVSFVWMEAKIISDKRIY